MVVKIWKLFEIHNVTVWNNKSKSKPERFVADFKSVIEVFKYNNFWFSILIPLN